MNDVKAWYRSRTVWGALIAIEPYGEPGSNGLTLLGSQRAVDDHSPAHYLPTIHFAQPMRRGRQLLFLPRPPHDRRRNLGELPG